FFFGVLCDYFKSFSGPLAVGKRNGDDAKVALPGLGTFGVGDVKSTMAKFIPAGMSDETPNGGTYDLADKPNLGYMDRETTAGKTSGSLSKVSLSVIRNKYSSSKAAHMSFGGIGTLQVGEEKEQGTGLLDFSKTYVQEERHTAVDPRLGELYYPKPKSYVDEAEKLLEANPPTPATPFKEIKEIKSGEVDFPSENPFDMIKSRPGYPGRARVHAVKTAATEDDDLLPIKEPFEDKSSEGFIKQKSKEKFTEAEQEDLVPSGGVQNFAA
ncbi:unnamed protein product, partial [Cylicostephanus goldi]